MTKVSVIIPSFNRADYLKEAVESVIKQSYQDFEILIIDDHSSDSELSKILLLEQVDERITLIQNPENYGVSRCRNFGIEISRGEYILFLDDDDIIGPRAIEEALDEFEQAQNIDVVLFTGDVHPKSNKNMMHYHFLKEVFRDQPYDKPYDKNNFYLFFNTSMAINSLLFKKDVFKYRVFDDGLSFGEDTYFLTSLLKHNVKYGLKFCGKNARAYVRIHGINHLSMPHIDQEILFCELIKSEFFPLDKKSEGILNLRLLVRYIKTKNKGKTLTTLKELLLNPYYFLYGLFRHYKLKIKALRSFYVFKWFKYDIQVK